MKVDEMAKYVNSIRNVAKRSYAKRYAIWLTRNMNTSADVPEPDYDCSYMAAQAVRIALNRLFE